MFNISKRGKLKIDKAEAKKKIDKIKKKLKKEPIVKKKFKKYKVPIDKLDDIKVEFADMDVSAKTKGGEVFINSRFFDDEDEIEAYFLHETVHYLQQTTDSLEEEEMEKDYLDNDHETEAFQAQVEYKEKEEGEQEAERYVDQVLDHHDIKGKERKEKTKELLSKASKTKPKKSEYKEKKTEESGNITYVYSEKHVARRNKLKAAKVEKLKKSISKVRTQIQKDIINENPRTRLPALAVALIDETYERVGNRKSARELKHYGVTEWLVKHIKFSGNTAKLNYTGKSGVKQKKEVKEKAVIKALKDAVKGKGPNDQILSEDKFSLNDNHVNHYLKPFSITAKDIRGFHANEEMRRQLKKVRTGALPKEDKEKKLKEEFKKALEETAKVVGHEASTLKSQYLVPDIESKYLSGGKS